MVVKLRKSFERGAKSQEVMCVDEDMSPGLLAEVTPLLSQLMLKHTCRLHALSASGGLSMGPVSQVPLGLLSHRTHGASPVSWLNPSHLA